MHHVMFDIDGTLVQSYKLDEECYTKSVFEVLGHNIDTDWTKYQHITDSGILSQHLKNIGLYKEIDELEQKIKDKFIKKTANYISKNPVREILGASKFIEKLKNIENVSISIATGGWFETASMKLESAGIDISGIPIATSSDHFSRTEIMKLAMSKAKIANEHKVSYFGDAKWDQEACDKLGFNFILVGNTIKHSKIINDFKSVDKAMKFIGL